VHFGEIPAVHRVLDEPAVRQYEPTLGRETTKRAVEQTLDRARASDVTPSYEGIVASVCERLEEIRLRTLGPVINATGIIVHTNLGRAPLGIAALEAIDTVGGGYSNLEYDLVAGERGSRYDKLIDALKEACGAAGTLVVNNCAAAVLLILDTFAKDREVVVARNQLVEIGGGFRIPEVIGRSGATLIEVGTTNRVYIEDFASALSPRTALLLRTHPSNYRIEGFTSDVSGAEIVALGRRAGVPVVEDLGSGALVDLADYGLPHERTVQEALADGIDLVTFSGDKLLGGPQAGIIVGKEQLVARLRANPLLRALRVDKLTIAALDATLRAYRNRAERDRIPIFRMLALTMDALRARSTPYLAAISGSRVVDSQAYVGGGALPQAQIASIAVAVPVPDPDRIADRLRRRSPAVVARIDNGRLLFDLRTIAPEEDVTLIAIIRDAIPTRS
jgi:L-seryl-tRNA(Ser) seleniumtransferase